MFTLWFYMQFFMVCMYVLHCLIHSSPEITWYYQPGRGNGWFVKLRMPPESECTAVRSSSSSSSTLFFNQLNLKDEHYMSVIGGSKSHSTSY